MYQQTFTLGYRPLFISVLGSVALVSGCSFDASGIAAYDYTTLVKDVPATVPFDGGRFLAVDIPGEFQAWHGFSCAASHQVGGDVAAIRIEEGMEPPHWVTGATVFNNGWHAGFNSGDRPVLAMTSGITHVEFTPGHSLFWDAGGLISDNNNDDQYEFCYRYTVLYWNENTYDLAVNHRDEGNTVVEKGNPNHTAQKRLQGFIHDPDFITTNDVAVIPRGFGVIWDGDDHPLLQLAYDLGEGQPYIQDKDYMNDMAPVFSSGDHRTYDGFVSWDSQIIFKDDAKRRDYVALELTSALSGNSLTSIEPPFSILPKNDTIGCDSAQSGVKIETREVTNLPFEVAIPVLSGWDLEFDCDDQQVTDIGVWIEDWKYTLDPSGLTGTLTYTLKSTLTDKNLSPGFHSRINVNILGLEAARPVEWPQDNKSRSGVEYLQPSRPVESTTREPASSAPSKG